LVIRRVGRLRDDEKKKRTHISLGIALRNQEAGGPLNQHSSWDRGSHFKRRLRKRVDRKVKGGEGEASKLISRTVFWSNPR